MSNYKGHLAGGFVFYCITLYVLTWYYSPSLAIALEWLFFTLAGSLFPDVDVKSKGQHYFYWIIAALLGYLILWRKWRTAAFVSILTMVPMLVRHRGLFHNTLFNILFPFVAALFFVSYVPSCRDRMLLNATFFVIGALSHLWLDLGLRRMLRI